MRLLSKCVSDNGLNQITIFICISYSHSRIDRLFSCDYYGFVCTEINGLLDNHNRVSKCIVVIVEEYS